MSIASETIDETEAAASPRPSLALRLKRLVAAPLLLLHRLHRPPAQGGDEAADAEQARGERGGAAVEDEAIAAGPSLWRRLLPYGAVLLAGIGAGGGTVYWLSVQAISRQTAALNEQQAEAARLRGVLAGYDKMMLQNRKKLDEELSRRVEAENRLAVAQADLTRQAPAAGNRRNGAQPGNAAGAGKMADCTLSPGSIGSTLKGCLEEFNGR